MAQFYAEIHGSRGPTSRLGAKSSGIRTTTKSYEGEINVTMWWNEEHDRDFVRVTMQGHEGHNGNHQPIKLYEGPVDAWRTFDGIDRLAVAAASGQPATAL